MGKSVVVLIVIILLCSACAGNAPAVVSQPTTIPQTPEPTPAPVAVVPVPTPTAAGPVPQIVDIPDQSISDRESFPQLALSDYLADPTVIGIRWTCEGNVDLECVVMGQALRVLLPNREWTGSETLSLTACYQQACDSEDVNFTVRAENDSPVFNLYNQVVAPGESFPPISLTQIVSDEEDPPASITWSASGDGALAVDIADNILTVAAPNAEWLGPETVHLRACDTDGGCTGRDVVFKVLEDSDLVVTHIGIDGFLFSSGGKKVLIDGMYSVDYPQSVAALVENAAPPFDNIDLILATHNHSDHFDAQMIRGYLEKNPQTIFVSTEQAVNDLKAGYPGFSQIEERVVAISLTMGQDSEERTLNGVDLKMVNLTHGDPESASRNMGFLIDLGSYRLFHTGDIDPRQVTPAYVQPYGLTDVQIDIAMVPHMVFWDGTSFPLLREGIQAHCYIPMHLAGMMSAPDYGTMAREFPNSIILDKVLERWVLIEE